MALEFLDDVAGGFDFRLLEIRRIVVAEAVEDGGTHHLDSLNQNL